IHVNVTSGIWDAHGVFDPPVSSPIQFSAKFPLLIGQDWNAFGKSPIELTLDFPSVVMAELPRCFLGVAFQNGNLHGKLFVTETAQAPRVLGEIELSDGRLLNAPTNL